MAVNQCGGRMLQIVAMFLILPFITANDTLTEAELHENLFQRYNPSIIPRTSRDQPVNVTMQMSLISVDNIDEKKQTVSVRVMLTVTWTDQFLVWDPDEYGSIDSIFVQIKDIWTPDISLNASLGIDNGIKQLDSRPSVQNNGHVITIPIKLYTVGCKIMIRKFPFDEQNCEFAFLSWSAPADIVNLTSSSSSIHLDSYQENGEWKIVNTAAENRQVEALGSVWMEVIYKISLKRKSLFYTLNIIAPVVLISTLNLLCFILPTASGERITLSVSILLTLVVFLTVVNGNMPESSDDVSVLSLYIGLQIGGGAASIVMIVLSLHVYYKDTAEVSTFMWFLARVCGVLERKRPAQDDGDSTNDVHSTKSEAFESDVKPSTRNQWECASAAIDRACIFCGMCWHITLLGLLIAL